MNPPFERLARVVGKIIEDGARVVLVVPIWDNEPWWTVLESITVNHWDLPKDVCLYQNEQGKELPQRAWGSRAVLVDGTFGGLQCV